MKGSSSFNKCIAKIYLLFYLLYIVLITFSKFTAYYSYLHSFYEVVVILSIFLNLIFVVALNINKSRIDIIGCVFTLLIIISLIIGLLTQVEIMTIPLAAIYLFIINLRNIDFHAFIKKDLCIKIFLLIIIILLYLCHLCPNISYNVLYRNGLPRLSMGFSVYAMFSSFVFCIILSYMLFLGKRSYNIKYLLLFIFISIIMFFLTDTRAILISELLIIFLLLIGRVTIIRSIIEFISIPFSILMALIAFIIPLDITPMSPSFTYWNKLFSNRLVLQQLAVKFNPIKLFGHKHIITNSYTILGNNEKLYVDNTYLLLILTCGIIGFIIFEFLLLRCCYISIHYDNYLLCVMLISLLLLFITEVFFNNINIYTPIICACMLNNPQLREPH